MIVRGASSLPAPRRHGRDGFTLIELVVVMLVLAVATALAVPAWLAPRQDDDMTDALRRVDALFRIARDSAARSGSSMVLLIDSASSVVWLLPEREPVDAPADAVAGGDAARRVMNSSRPRPPGLLQRTAAQQDEGTSLELPASVRLELSRARARFVFTPGGAAFGDSVNVRRGVQTRLVTIDPWTGNALIR